MYLYIRRTLPPSNALIHSHTFTINTKLQTKFEELQPETVNAQVLKYAKTVYQLEKGLPPNGVVPNLKVKVEDMKDKVW